MYLALIALLAVASGWVAWRKNPLFSLRSTLRFVVLLAAMVAGFVLALLVVIQYTQRLPQNLQLGALFGAVGVLTIIVIAVTIQLSLPTASPLPAAAKHLNVFRKRTYVWAGRFAWALVAFAALELVLRGSAQIAVGTVGGLFAFIGVTLLVGLYMTAHRTDSWLSAVEADPWVHWTYTPEQWRRWTDTEAERAIPDPTSLFHWRRDWKKVTPTLTAMLVVPLCFAGEPWMVRLIFTGVIAALIVIIVAWVKHSTQEAPAAMRRKLVGATPDVYFGRDGLFANGEFTPWLTAGVYLQAAYVDERQPRSLALKFCKIQVGYQMQTVTMNVDLPLPEGSGVADDLARLQRELGAKCVQASVSLA